MTNCDTQQGYPGFSISPAKVSDIPEMVRVHRDSLVEGYINREEPEMGANREALETFAEENFVERKYQEWYDTITTRLGNYAVRLNCACLVGLGACRQDEAKNVATIDALYIAPDFQRRGIGSAVLQKMVRQLPQETVRLNVTRWAHAVQFYKKHGFKETGRPQPLPGPPLAYGIKLEQIEMELQRSRPLDAS